MVSVGSWLLLSGATPAIQTSSGAQSRAAQAARGGGGGFTSANMKNWLVNVELGVIFGKQSNTKKTWANNQTLTNKNPWVSTKENLDLISCWPVSFLHVRFSRWFGLSSNNSFLQSQPRRVSSRKLSTSSDCPIGTSNDHPWNQATNIGSLGRACHNYSQ